MTHFSELRWWKATEIPLADTDWRNIRLYCKNQGTGDPWSWTRCVYCIRLAPPFAIHYEDDDERRCLVSPLIYIGSGSIKQRWSSHREWLGELAYALPGARYEVWVCQPRVKNAPYAYKGVEGYLLTTFQKQCGFLPLRNRKIQGHPEHYGFNKEIFDEMAGDDRRFTWAIWPQRGPLERWYYKGG